LIFPSGGGGSAIFTGGNGGGSGSSNVPVVQNSLLAVDTNTSQSVTNDNTKTTLYQVGIYLESRGDGAGGTELTATIAWTSPAGDDRTVTLVLDGNTSNIQMENYIILALASTDIVVSTVFSSTSFHYDIGVSIALLPTG
jgi:hypothetical protein